MWYITENILVEMHKVLMVLRYKREEFFCIKFCTVLQDPELKSIEVTYADEESRDRDFQKLKEILSSNEPI